MAARVPNPIDAYIGSRLRFQRMMLGMTQDSLATALGITFQQVQKYEKGINRIGAARLQAVSGLLCVPVSFFFQQDSDRPLTLAGVGVADEANRAAEFLSSREGIALNKAFVKVKNPKTRKSIIALARVLAKVSDESLVDFVDVTGSERLALN